MKKKIITRIAEGLGNQLFMYANSFSLSKKLKYDFFIDDKSAYFQSKNIRTFLLDNFNISARICEDSEKFNTVYLNFVRKILKKIDLIKKQKKFLVEKKDIYKKTMFYNFLDGFNPDYKLFVEGHFESEKYFLEYRNSLITEFTLKQANNFFNNKFYNHVSNNNAVSICIRQNRFSERINNKNDELSISKSKKLVKTTINYIKRAEKFIETKIPSPNYFIWSNDFSNLREYFPENKYQFVENHNNKVVQDFFLMTQCKNFIVGPTSFHWWGAWLSNKDNKICVRPQDINPSNNTNFWPDSWIKI